jgi:hypothetical protein
MEPVMLKRRPLLVAGYLALGAIPAMVSCNAFTGASDLRLEDDEDSEDDVKGPGGPILPGIDGPGEAIPVDTTVEAGGVSIDAIALYQGLKRPLMEGGVAATSDLPIIAGREALIRVFVTPDSTHNGQPVIGRLYLGASKTPIEATAMLGGASTDADLSSTINFEVPGALITLGSTYRVELRQNEGASAPVGMTKYPAAGAEPLQLSSDGQTLKVVVVPVQYKADGSNRMPDISPEQVKLYKDWFYSYYPIPAVELTVREEPMPWASSIAANGSGWDTLLTAVGDLRQTDGATSDVYYYGIFAPTATEGEFCGGGRLRPWPREPRGRGRLLPARGHWPRLYGDAPHRDGGPRDRPHPRPAAHALRQRGGRRPGLPPRGRDDRYLGLRSRDQEALGSERERARFDELLHAVLDERLHVQGVL